MSFIRKHWLGQYSLKFSFWFICIFLGFVFHLVSSLILQQISPAHFATFIFYQFIGGLLLLPWQVVGVLRSAEQHFKNHGRPIILHSVQAAILVGLTGIMSHFIDQIQTLTIKNDLSNYQSKTISTQYNIRWHEDKKQIQLSGPLDIGITHAVRQILLTHPNAKQIVLESEGGQVYEGRGLAALFNQYKIDTYSFRYCLSSCATAFIGGAKRFLGNDAKLGFHQYAFDSKQLQPFRDFYNVEDEQDKDREVYRSKNINERFIQQIFKKPNSEIWYPDRKTLLEAGVVTATVLQ
jgi:hypothetical protein